MTPFHAFSKVKDGEISPVEALLNQKDTLQSTPSTQFSAIQKTQTMPESLGGKALSAFESSTYEKRSAPAQAEQKPDKKLSVTMYARVNANKSYELTIESAGVNSLFIFPAQIEQLDAQKPLLIDRFFNINKRRFIFKSSALEDPELIKASTIPERDDWKVRMVEKRIPSYMDTINTMSLIEAQRILAQQGVVTRSRNFFLEKLIKVDPLTRAKALAKVSLAKLNESLANILMGDDYAIKNVDLLDSKQRAQNPKAGMIYNAIREFGQVIGFEMPSIEKPWYVRHKGKIALTAGALALLTYMHYSNTLGTRTSTVQQAAPTAQPIQVSKPSLATQLKTNTANYVRDITAKAAISQAAAATKSVQVEAPSTWRGWAENKVGSFLYKTLIEREAARIQNTPAPQAGFWARQINKVVDKALPAAYAGWAGYQPKILPTK